MYLIFNIIIKDLIFNIYYKRFKILNQLTAYIHFGDIFVSTSIAWPI